MELKDWISLFVPILFNGVIFTIWGRKFEKKQMVLKEKYKYVDALREKVDAVLQLSVFEESLSERPRGIIAQNIIDRWVEAYSYYLQNSRIFMKIAPLMEKCLASYESMGDAQKSKSESAAAEFSKQLSLLIDGLREVQLRCIEYKV